jgi:hypothetical protein
MHGCYGGTLIRRCVLKYVPSSFSIFFNPTGSHQARPGQIQITTSLRGSTCSRHTSVRELTSSCVDCNPLRFCKSNERGHPIQKQQEASHPLILRLVHCIVHLSVRGSASSYIRFAFCILDTEESYQHKIFRGTFPPNHPYTGHSLDQILVRAPAFCRREELLLDGLADRQIVYRQVVRGDDLGTRATE